jgi:uncharacterized protein
MSMSLGFFGGASGIGASCVLVRGASFCAVVDCGIRQARGETLPDLSGLQDALGGGRPDVIVLTHAHLDHSGALPVLHRTWPEVPIVTTTATAALVRILLQDALKVMDAERDAELPLYGRDEVASTLAALRPVRFDEPVVLGDGTIRLLPAGHILGAGSAWVEVGGRSVLVTGDISVADQRTVAGMPTPRVRPDALVVESTYGERLHASREAEERRLVEQVAEAVLDGGHVLVPAFAVGRAQEVLLILRDAMRRGRIPRFPVYADGMVRAVCRVYRDHPTFLHPRLRRQALREGPVFFPEGSGFEPIASREHRDAVIAGPPCCVVASSGMLAGGASPLYARAWAKEPRSLISITGYQDEEAPGRALLSLADGRGDTLQLPGGAVQVRCRTGRYQLSAHADADEITALALGLRPRSVFLVHGDDAAREALAKRLGGAVRARVLLPRDGDIVPLSRSVGQVRRGWQGPGIGGGAPLDGHGLGRLRDLLGRQQERGRALTAEELAAAWFGQDPGPGQVGAVLEALEKDQDAFQPDRRHPSRFRPVAAARPRTGPAPLAEVLDAVERLIPASSGLYKRSTHQEERRIVLRFHFPDVQGAASREAMERITGETGWRLEVHPAPHQGELAAAARALLQGRCQVVGGPSLRLEERRVELAVSTIPPDAAELSCELEARTGWSLGLEVGGPVDPAQVPAGGPTLSPQDSRPLVLAAFEDVQAELAPAKVSYPEGALLLRFVHPGLAERHTERIAELAGRTGRAVQVHPHPIPQRLLPLVRARLPASWTITRELAWMPQRGAVQVRVWTTPPDEERTRVEEDVLAATGCRLEVVDDG